MAHLENPIAAEINGSQNNSTNRTTNLFNRCIRERLSMTLRNQCLALLAGLVMSFNTLAATIDVAGVKLEDAVDVTNKHAW